MNENFSDELISAYLDGELTADEQLQVERALAENAEYRQMFEELRTLRDNLQSLPSYQLDDQFAARVLRRAEKEMLSPPSGSSGGSDPPDVQRQSRSWRGVILSVASLAAMIIVALFLFSQMSDPNIEMASAPQNSMEEAQSEPDLNMPTADSAALGHHALGDRLGNAVPKSGIASSKDVRPQNGRPEMKRKSTVASKGANKGSKADASAVQGAVGPAGGGKGDFGTPKALKSNRVYTKGGSSNFKSADVQKAKIMDHRPRAKSQVAPKVINKSSRARMATGKSPKNSPEKNSFSYRITEQLADDLIIVTLNVTPQARKSGALYKALQKHRILPQENLALDALSSQANKKGDRLLQEKVATDEKKLVDSNRLDSETSLLNEMDLIYVQATYQQLQAALNELKQQAGFSGLALQALSMEREVVVVPLPIASAPVPTSEAIIKQLPSQAGRVAGIKKLAKPADVSGKLAPQLTSETTKLSSSTLTENNSSWPAGRYRRISKPALNLEDLTTLRRSLLAPPQAIAGSSQQGKSATKESEKLEALSQKRQATPQTKPPVPEKSLNERVGQPLNRAHQSVRVLIVARTVASPQKAQATEGTKASPKPPKP